MLGASPAAEIPIQPSVSHLLAPGDLLEVQLFDGASRDQFNVQVDSLGEVTLPLVGRVPLLGLRPRAAADLLQERYQVFYKQPVVSLIVRSYGEIQIFVFGPDFSGQMVSLPTGSRLLDLLSTASLAPSAMNERWQEIQHTGDSATAVSNGKLARTTSSLDVPPPAMERNPLYTRGSYRRLHLIRGSEAFADLIDVPSQGGLGVADTSASQGGAVPLDLSAGSSVAVDVDSKLPRQARPAGLSNVMNWRRWIAEKQQDGQTKLWVIDPLRITLEGELSRYNMPLQDGDVLYIPVPERFVQISGVAKPGRYELLEEETLGDLLRISGSVDFNSDLRNALVERFAPDGRLARIVTNLYPGLNDHEQLDAFRLENRDRISLSPPEDRVFVLGEVNAAGAFRFSFHSTVLDYLALAEGETPDAHLAWIAIIRQQRDRLDSGAAPEVLRVNFKELHAGYPGCAEVEPLPGDVIYVPPKGQKFELAPILQAVGTVVSGYAFIDRAQSD